MHWWVADLLESKQYALLISQVFWVLFSITMHELAHGWAAIWQGDNTPRQYRRMTMNPVVHMGQWSLIMFALVGIAWGVMPVDPSRFRWKRRGRIVVSGAGPAMNIVLGFIVLTGTAFWLQYGPMTQPLNDNVRIFLFTGGWLNLFLAVFNLLPVPPFDGASILMGTSMRFYRLYQHPQVQSVSFFVILVVFMSGLSSLLFGVTARFGRAYVDAIQGILP
jgi:Zn-dependent protease